MTENDQKELGNTLWKLADDLRGAMNVSMNIEFSTHCVENFNEISA